MEKERTALLLEEILDDFEVAVRLLLRKSSFHSFLLFHCSFFLVLLFLGELLFCEPLWRYFRLKERAHVNKNKVPTHTVSQLSC